MRKLAIAMALASTALATPAVARDNSWYVGVEGGLMIVEDGDFDATALIGGRTVSDAVAIDHKTGVDVDLIGGYDFGAIRAEVEAGYKRASLDQIDQGDGIVDVDGSVRVLSVMANVLLDFGDDDWNGYVGGGVGLANVRYDIDFNSGGFGSGRDTDRSFAYQGIAGVRKALTYNLDLGLKYRYFVAPKLNYDIQFGDVSGRYKSHSLLASLIYNFGAPAVDPAAAAAAPSAAPAACDADVPRRFGDPGDRHLSAAAAAAAAAAARTGARARLSPASKQQEPRKDTCSSGVSFCPAAERSRTVAPRGHAAYHATTYPPDRGRRHAFHRRSACLRPAACDDRTCAGAGSGAARTGS